MTVAVQMPVCCTAFGKLVRPEGGWQEPEVCAQHRLFGLMGSRLTVQINGDTYTAADGAVLLVPAGAAFRVLSTQRCAYYYYAFTDSAFAEARPLPAVEDAAYYPPGEFLYAYTPVASPGLELDVVTEPIDVYRTKDIYERCTALKVWKNPMDKYLQDQLMGELLIYLSREYRQKSTVPRQVQEMVRYVHAHYKSPLSLESLAAVFEVSRSYVARCFREHVGMTCGAFIRKVRLASARDLLANSEQTVGEIAEQCGFASLYYFSRCFSATFGQSPTAFRREAKTTK